MQRPSHKARFNAMRDEGMLNRVEQYAKWTLPQLMVDQEDTVTAGTRVVVERDYQEMGALLVNNLGAKLAGLLFPTSRPFYRATLSDDLMKRAKVNNQPSEVQGALARMEMDSCQQIFKNASYNQLVLAAKHLIVTGNVMTLRDSENKRSITYGITQFACQRDGRGQLLDAVLREFTFFEALDPDTQAELRAVSPGKYARAHLTPNKCRVELFTRIQYTRSKRGKPVWKVSQEVDESPIGETSTYPEHLCPYQVITWSLIPGEHYGRGLVEDYAGGFASLSDQSHALTLYGISASKVVNMVASGSGTDVDRMADADHGEWVTGDPNTVAAYEAGDAMKIKVLMERIQDIYGRLATAFMYTGNTRNAERVTAFELQQQASEANATLGGTYSALAEAWQVPLAHLLLTEVNPGILQGIVTNRVKLDITAGAAALGRSTVVQNLLSCAQEGAVIVQALISVDKRIDPAKVMDLVYAGQSVDTTALFKSQDQQDKEAQAQQLAAQGQQQVLNAASQDATQEALGKIAGGQI